MKKTYIGIFVCVILFVTNSFVAAQSGPVAYWPFNDNTDSTPDDVANGNHGTFVDNTDYQGGTSIPPAPDNINTIELDGSGDYVTVADNPTLDMSGSMTLSAWVSLDINKPEHNIISKDTLANFTNYNLHVHNNHVFFSTILNASVGNVAVFSGSGSCDSGGCFVHGASTFVDSVHPLGSWRHIAAVYNNATKTMSVYLDGVKDGEISLTTSGSPSTNNEALQIGKRKAFAGNDTDGRIDEVKIHNRALSAQEIAQEFSSLAAYWPFNDNTDTTPDDVANDNDGTFIGNATYQGGTNIPATADNVDAIELHGGYVSAVDSPTLDMPGSLTLSAWVSLDINRPEQNIISKDTPGNLTNYNLHVLENRVFFSMVFATGTIVAHGSALFVDALHPTGTWKHVAAVYNNITKTMSVYLDGIKNAEVSVGNSGSPSTNNEAVQIGKRKAFSVDTDGRIDEVKIYNRALSEQEIIALSQVNPTPAPSYTPTGIDVPVQPIDPTTGAVPATLTFSSVTQAGDTNVISSTTGPDPASGFKVGDPVVYYDISTTAGFSGSISICLSWAEGQFDNENNIALFHYENGAWTNITTSRDTVANEVCGQTFSLSPFALFENSFAFTGFFAPVDNPPTRNVAKAGSAIPVKFSLGGDQGLSIFSSGFPVSQTVACDSSAILSDVEETVLAGGSSLSYDATFDQYIYVWKTNKAWANTCRRLVVKFIDGTTQTAEFSFNK